MAHDYPKDVEENCGRLWGISGTCKHHHFCYRSCVHKYRGDICNKNSLIYMEGRCVTAAEKKKLERYYYPKKFDNGTVKLRRAPKCQDLVTLMPPLPKKKYLLVDVPEE